jgi:hypothetical protein
MLSRLFPKQIDNNYRGHVLAIWLFIPIALMNITIAVCAIVLPDGGAQSPDGVPLNTFSAGAAQTVIGVVALIGLAKLLLGLLFILALLRYRAMIPLMYLLLVTDYIGHKWLGLVKPIMHVAGTSTGTIVLVSLFAASVIGLILSLSGKGYHPKQGMESARP